MDASRVHNMARRLVELHGAKAELEAAQKLRDAEESGDEAEINLWRRVRAAVHDMKPAHES